MQLIIMISTDDTEGLYSRLVKTPDEILKMREAGHLAAKVLEALNTFIKPGITTAQIDEFCEDYIVNVL